jgi:hypothetical protein
MGTGGGYKGGWGSGRWVGGYWYEGMGVFSVLYIYPPERESMNNY